MATYALVTPARDEAENLRRLAKCIIEQTVTPSAWIVVDDGSTDGSATEIAELARAHPWIGVMSSPGVVSHPGETEAGRRAGRDVVAFNAGVASLEASPDFVVKLDADVSFDRDFFERLLREFDRDPTLGISGAECYELDDGEWRQRFVTGSHVRGATRVYRWECWEAVQPLEVRLGWDGIDELKAEALGWRVRSVEGLVFLHHRAPGHRDGALAKWARAGRSAHYLGYRFPYLVLRSLYRAKGDPAALAMIWGYLGATLRREPRYPDLAMRKLLREKQSLRRLPLRIREAQGRPARAGAGRG